MTAPIDTSLKKISNLTQIDLQKNWLKSDGTAIKKTWLGRLVNWLKIKITKKHTTRDNLISVINDLNQNIKDNSDLTSNYQYMRHVISFHDKLTAVSSKSTTINNAVSKTLTPLVENAKNDLQIKAFETLQTSQNLFKGSEGLKAFQEILKKCNETNQNLTDENGNTLLHYAVQIGTKDLVEALLTQDFVKVEAQNSNGDTALHIAAKDAKKDLLNLLTEKLGGISSVTNKQGNTPFHLITEHDIQGAGVKSWFDALGCKNFPPSEEEMDKLCVTNDDGFTPIDLVIKNVKSAFLSEIFNFKEQKIRGDTPFTIPEAAKTKLAETIETVLQNGFDEEYMTERFDLVLFWIATTNPDILGKIDIKNIDLNNITLTAKYILSHLDDTKKHIESHEKSVLDSLLSTAKSKIKSIKNEIKTYETSNKTITVDAKTALKEDIGDLEPPSVRIIPYAYQLVDIDKNLTEEKLKNLLGECKKEKANFIHRLADPEQEKEWQPYLMTVFIDHTARKNLKIFDENGKLPIHVAIEKGNFNFLDIIFDPTIRYSNIIDYGNETELVDSSGKNVIEYAIEKYIEFKNTNQELAQKYEALIKLLISKCPKLANETNITNDQKNILTEEIMNYLNNAGLAHLGEMIQKDLADYVHRNIQIDIADLRSKLEIL